MVIKLDGTDDYIQCSNDSTLWSQALTNFSFSIWFYAPANPTGSDKYIISHGNASNQGFRLIYVVSSKVLNFSIKSSGGTNFDALSDIAVVAGTWNHVLCTYDNSLGSANIKMYVNGVLQADTGNLTETINLSDELTIGTEVSANTPNTYTKDFRFWKRKTFSSTEALQLYQGKDETDFDPDYWLPMDEGTGNPKSWGLRAKLVNGARWASDNNSVFFDGIDDYIDCNIEPTLWSKSLTKFSISVWVKASVAFDAGNNGYRTFFGLADDPSQNDEISMYFLRGGTDTPDYNSIGCDITNDSYATTNNRFSSSQIDLDKWYNVVLTFDNTLTNCTALYINGVLQSNSNDYGASYNGKTINIDSVTKMLLGKYIVSDINPFCGNIKKFKFWNSTALTANNAKYLYDDTTGTAPVTATYELDMDEGSAQPKDDISDPKTATLTNGALWAWNSSTLTTSDYSYTGRVGYKIVVKSNDEMKTYFRYDTFGSKPFNSVGLRTTLADKETDLSLLAIEDSADALDDNKLAGGVKYFISFTTGETVPYEDLFVGYGELLEASAEARNKIIKYVTILGSQVLATYRYLNYNRAAKISELDDPSTVKGREFESWFHVDRAISKSSELLYDKIIIKNSAHWDDIDLHKEVNTIIAGIALGTVNLWDFMEYQRSITGATWGTDFRNKKERFFYGFPELTPTNIILKSGYEKTSADLANQVAWIFHPFSYLKDTSTDVNHTTLLHGITDVDDVFIAGSPGSAGSTTLTYKAIGQSFPLPVDAKRIKRINLKLSMKGEVSSPENKVNGKLCLADASGKPLGTKLDKFTIPLSDIDKDPTVVTVSVDVDPEDIEGDSTAWILLYQRSGTDEKDKGDPNHDESNTILWHHNNIIGTAGQYPSATAQEGDRHKEPLNWIVKSTGPQYAFSVNSDLQRIETIMTPQLFPTYGVKENILNVSELRDRTTVNSFLQYKAFLLSQQKRYIPAIKTKIVNNMFYRPNQTLLMTVAKPKIAATMRVQRVTYDIRPISEQTGENNSSRLCTLSLVEIINPANYVKFNCDY